MTWPFSSDRIILGSSSPHLPIVGRVGLSSKEQRYHAAIFGRSGSGTSKLLQGVFLQHVSQGNGVGVLEPHHDLSFDCLSSLVGAGFFKREDAFRRLIYLDWGNGAFVPFNVLASRGDPYTVSLNALDAMLRVWPELREAPLFQTLFLSSMMTLIANGLPITFLYRLLTEKAFRDACLERVSDPLIHQQFEHYDKLGRDQPQAAGSTLRRAYLLTFNPLARYTLGQPDNLLDFRRLMDEGVAFIINLGNVGDPETRKLIGAMVMVQLEQAALSRSDLLPSQRRPLTLLVDEWPSFAAQADTISHLLSQARKFNLRLYLAAQSLSQVDSTRLVGALENCKLQVAFGLGRDSAVTQARHIGDVDPLLVKEEYHTASDSEGDERRHFFPVLEQFEGWARELQNLKPREAYVKLEGKAAVKIKTLTIREPRVSSEQLSEVVSTYKALYQRTREDAEVAIATLTLPLPARRVFPQAASPAYTRLFQSKDNDEPPN